MWQREALKRYIEEQRNTPGFAEKTVFLSDPERERELDERLLRSMWPGVTEALAPSRWVPVVDGEPGSPVGSQIRTQRHAEIGRALTYLIEDPDRPRRPETAPPWFCRGTVSCTAASFSIAFDFILTLPANFPFPEILRVLSEPRLVGCPPELRFSRGIPAACSPTLELGLTWGEGTLWWNDKAPLEAAREATEKNVAAIDAVHDLERDYGNRGAYDRVCERLIAAYEAF